MSRVHVTCILAVCIAVTMVIVETQTTMPEDCGALCFNDTDCTGKASCLCQTDTCENSTCDCTRDFYRDDAGICQKKMPFGGSCKSLDACKTTFSVCTAGTCKCPDGQQHDTVNDECTDAWPCPKDATYIQRNDSGVHFCYKVIKNCTNCINVQNTCASEGSVGIVLDTTQRWTDFVSLLWKFGFISSSGDPESVAQKILLATDHTTTSWLWPNGKPIAGVSYNANEKCLYLEYDGMTSKKVPHKTCNLTTANIGCMITSSCPAGNDSYGKFWNRTLAGEIAKQPCPIGRNGTVTRQCLASGVFKQAYYDCKLAVVKDISEQLNNGSINATEALDLLNTKVVTGNESLYITDLITVQNTLAKVSNLSQNETVTNTTADNYFEVVNFLIDSNNTKAWESNIDQEEPEAEPEPLLTTIDNFVKQVSKGVETLNQSISIIKPNLELEVKLLTKELDGTRPHINFPPPKEREANGKGNATTYLFLDKKAFEAVNVTSSSSVLYKNLSSIISSALVSNTGARLPTSEMNSPVLALTLNPNKPVILNPKLNLTFIPFKAWLSQSVYSLDKAQTQNFNFKEIKAGFMPQCAYWEAHLLDGKGAWSPQGCELISFSASVVHCRCDHLTNFALLISPSPASEAHERVLRIISLVGCAISMLCLAITIFLYGCYWRFLKSDNATLTFAVCISLFVAYVVFIIGVEQTLNKDACTAIAVILHYLYLLVFFMMLAEGLHMMTKVTMVYNRTSYVKQFLLGAFVFPAVIVAVSAGVSQLEGYGNEHYCWLTPGRGVFWAFAGPVLAIILANILIIMLIFKKLFSTTSMKNKDMDEKMKLSAWTLFVLMPIMGVTWLFGIFSVNKDQVYWQYIFVVLNTLQGFGIFLFHCVLNKQLRAAIQAQRERKKSTQTFSSELKKRTGDSSKSNDATSHSRSEQSTTANDYSTSHSRSEQSTTANDYSTPTGINKKSEQEDSSGVYMGETRQKKNIPSEPSTTATEYEALRSSSIKNGSPYMQLDGAGRKEHIASEPSATAADYVNMNDGIDNMASEYSFAVDVDYVKLE